MKEQQNPFTEYIVEYLKQIYKIDIQEIYLITNVLNNSEVKDFLSAKKIFRKIQNCCETKMNESDFVLFYENNILQPACERFVTIQNLEKRKQIGKTYQKLISIVVVFISLPVVLALFYFLFRNYSSNKQIVVCNEKIVISQKNIKVFEKTQNTEIETVPTYNFSEKKLYIPTTVSQAQ